jgi:hypothetical protein
MKLALLNKIIASLSRGFVISAFISLILYLNGEVFLGYPLFVGLAYVALTFPKSSEDEVDDYLNQHYQLKNHALAWWQAKRDQSIRELELLELQIDKAITAKKLPPFKISKRSLLELLLGICILGILLLFQIKGETLKEVVKGSELINSLKDIKEVLLPNELPTPTPTLPIALPPEKAISPTSTPTPTSTPAPEPTSSSEEKKSKEDNKKPAAGEGEKEGGNEGSGDSKDNKDGKKGGQGKDKGEGNEEQGGSSKQDASKNGKEKKPSDGAKGDSEKGEGKRGEQGGKESDKSKDLNENGKKSGEKDQEEEKEKSKKEQLESKGKGDSLGGVIPNQDPADTKERLLKEGDKERGLTGKPQFNESKISLNEEKVDKKYGKVIEESTPDFGEAKLKTKLEEVELGKQKSANDDRELVPLEYREILKKYAEQK